MKYSKLRLVGFTLGLPILVLSLMALRQSLLALEWPMTSGTVVQADKNGLSKKSLDLIVDYQVDQAAYKCEKIEFGTSPQWRDAYRYYVGANARVFYNPQDPGECVLEPGISGAIVIRVLIGLALSLLGLFAHGKFKSSISSKNISSRTLEEAHTLAEQGHLIEAIKVHRQVTGSGLKESKKYIDEHLKNKLR